MDATKEFFHAVKSISIKGHFLGLLHLLIARRITRKDGTVVAHGLTWRDLAGWLRKARWDTDAASELGLDAATLPPRDRERFWYQVISRAGVDSEAARRAADTLARKLRDLGYIVEA